MRASTTKKRLILVYEELASYIQQNGYAPTSNELRQRCGIASATFWQMLHLLQELRLIERTPHWRGARLMERTCPRCGCPITPRDSKLVIRGERVYIVSCNDCASGNHSDWRKRNPGYDARWMQRYRKQAQSQP